MKTLNLFRLPALVLLAGWCAATLAVPNALHDLPLDHITACGRPYTTHWVQQGAFRIHVREFAGSEPAIVLMHGFPENLHLYDRLVPSVCGRRLVLFDFIGWGNSDKPDPTDYAYTFANQLNELDAVITQRQLVKPVLVAHDASGPAAINWALDHEAGTGALVLLNTFYHLTPSLSAPEAIAIFADLLELRTAPLVPPRMPWSFGRLSQAIANSPKLFRALYQWQVGTFFRDETVRRQFLPTLFAQFRQQPSSIPAFVALNHDLGNAIGTNSMRVADLASFGRPVRIIFGDSDPYLNADLGRDFHAAFPRSELYLIPSAHHFVQMDEPAAVARLILSTPVP
jgi:haloalkane dehalogenase